MKRLVISDVQFCSTAYSKNHRDLRMGREISLQACTDQDHKDKEAIAGVRVSFGLGSEEAMY